VLTLSVSLAEDLVKQTKKAVPEGTAFLDRRTSLS